MALRQCAYELYTTVEPSTTIVWIATMERLCKRRAKLRPVKLSAIIGAQRLTSSIDQVTASTAGFKTLDRLGTNFVSGLLFTFRAEQIADFNIRGHRCLRCSIWPPARTVAGHVYEPWPRRILDRSVPKCLQYVCSAFLSCLCCYSHYKSLVAADRFQDRHQDLCLSRSESK